MNILFLISINLIFFSNVYTNDLLPAETNQDVKDVKDVKVRYILNFEPHVEDCGNFSRTDLIVLGKFRFKKINRRSIAVTTSIDLKTELAKPLKAMVTIEKYQQSSYVFFLEIPRDNICDDFNNKEALFYNIAKWWNVSSCPVQKRYYAVTNYTINLEQIDLGPQHVGRYRSKVTVSAMIENEMQLFYCKNFFVTVERERN